jgi:HEAT repeat protein
LTVEICNRAAVPLAKRGLLLSHNLIVGVSVPDGVEKTGRVLATTRNRAALSVLQAGLRSHCADVRAAVVRTTFRRHDVASHMQLIREFPSLREEDAAIYRETHRAMPHRAAPALKAALVSGEPKICRSACRIIDSCDDFAMFPSLIAVAENRNHREADEIARLILRLADRLALQLQKWSEGDRAGHDPAFARHQVLSVLENSLGRYAQHQRSEIVHAFLLLAPTDNETLLRILRNSEHPCSASISAALTTSNDPAIMARLVDMFRDIETPDAGLTAIANRTDRAFVELLLRELSWPVSVRVLHNMSRLSSVAWLESCREMLLDLDGRAQAVAIELATASQLSQDAIFELLALLMRGGMAEGRRASCQALAIFDGSNANELVLAALNDPDAAVRATAVRQLRPRRLPDALQRLVALLDSPSNEVREAARSSLAEFNFIRYRAMFDLLDEQAVRTTGRLVRKVDHSARERLIEELSSPFIANRLRGIEMAVAMGAASDISDQLVELTQHENSIVRKEAVTALAACHGEIVETALEAAMLDPNRSVADAARHSRAQMSALGDAVSTKRTAAVGERA